MPQPHSQAAGTVIGSQLQVKCAGKTQQGCEGLSIAGNPGPDGTRE